MKRRSQYGTQCLLDLPPELVVQVACMIGIGDVDSQNALRFLLDSESCLSNIKEKTTVYRVVFGASFARSRPSPDRVARMWHTANSLVKKSCITTPRCVATSLATEGASVMLSMVFPRQWLTATALASAMSVACRRNYDDVIEVLMDSSIRQRKGDLMGGNTPYRDFMIGSAIARYGKWHIVIDKTPYPHVLENTEFCLEVLSGLLWAKDHPRQRPSDEEARAVAQKVLSLRECPAVSRWIEGAIKAHEVEWSALSRAFANK